MERTAPVADDVSVSTARFYDGLAATYHALYPDWDKEIHDQARALTKLLGSPPPGSAIADTACGIGTQLLDSPRPDTTCSART